MKINKFAFNLSVLAAAALLASGAQANGAITPNAAGATATTYAAEAIGAATAVTLPNIVYTMGVARAAAGQDMTIIYDLPAGATFNTTPAAPTFTKVSGGGVPVPVITLKRGGAGSSQVVYSVSIDPVAAANSVNATDTFTLVAPAVKLGATSVGLGALTLNVTVVDQVETACVDNAGTTSTCFVTSKPATLTNVANFYDTVAGAVGVATDTATKTDVNAPVPLAGFVLAGDDTATVAKATVQIRNTLAGYKNAANTADYTLGASDLISVTVTDPTGFLGLAANGLGYALSSALVFAPSGTTATIATIPGNDANLSANRLFSFTSDAVTPMGVARTLSIAGSVTPAVGAAHNFTGNSTWWTWGSNGTILETPMAAYTTGYNNRFVFMNYGTTAVTYSTACLVEAGKTAVSGTGATGTLLAGKQTVVLAADVCTITGTATATGNAATRAGVRFTINAPSAIVKGVYNSVNNTTGAIDSIELVRPTTNANQF